MVRQSLYVGCYFVWARKKRACRRDLARAFCSQVHGISWNLLCRIISGSPGSADCGIERHSRTDAEARDAQANTNEVCKHHATDDASGIFNLVIDEKKSEDRP